MNRLATETSPYLRQHADNPVDWWPWGDEAFAEARRRDVPVLLSVGYSACHWCHVMAHESFEDPATAAVMNEGFVCVKVDREERPDVDAVYMEATQAMTGAGGWPMTVFCTPDGEPFFCGTYFPPTGAHGRPSFTELLAAVTTAWREQRDGLLDQAGRLTEHLRRPALAGVPGGDDVAREVHEGDQAEAAARLVAQHDDRAGGFGGAPKFPHGPAIDLLWRHHLTTGDGPSAQAAATTLDAMASGGMVDHLGGGFARYSVDARWLVPHFEKMLYDQASLLRAYTHGWQVTGNPAWRQVAEELVEYVVRDLRQPGGAFASAEDADSEGEEGRFYVWTPAQLREVLGDDLAGEAAAYWGVTDEGNFEGATTILNRLHSRGDLLRPEAIEGARQRLLAARSERVRPGLDDKVLTEWNALFTSALAEAGAALDRSDWVAAAAEAADFLLANLRDADGRWLRSWQADGGARHLALAADHAALVDAFTRLGEATGQARWTAEARAAADALLDRFADPDGPGFFTTAHDGDTLIARQKDLTDGATPSANGLAALALARLGALTGDDRYGHAVDALVAHLATVASQHPIAFAHLLWAADLRRRGAVELVVPGGEADLLAVARQGWRPRLVLAWGEPYPSPLWEGRSPGSAYVCQGFACGLPATDPGTLAAQLDAAG